MENDYRKFIFSGHIWENSDNTAGMMFCPQDNNWVEEFEICGVKVKFQTIASTMVRAFKELIETKKKEQIKVVEIPDEGYSFLNID